MKQYIATFFSHFGAIRFQRLCTQLGWPAQLAPVPRSLSSSCGTCVLFQTAELAKNDLGQLITPELEQLVLDDNGYSFLYTAEE
ncbi:MAG: DUF3343 domain-containing protein [Phascolarctobacterium sp.]|nr:DUF3343 domain-containing protein [Phascolarctobacterium sp.]